MSILSALFNSLTGSNKEEEETELSEEEQEYQNQLTDILYWVDHLDEFESKYEVISTDSASGSVTCPYCGANTANPYICEYCGSTLQQSDGKIRVTKASEIPSPILEAQDLIFEHHKAEEASAEESESTASTILNTLLGTTTEETETLGKKMTVDEIKEMAEYYDVSVSAYLRGLDSGKYLTLSKKESASSSTSYDSTASTVTTAATGTLAGALLGTALSSYKSKRTYAPLPKPPVDDNRIENARPSDMVRPASSHNASIGHQEARHDSLNARPNMQDAPNSGRISNTSSRPSGGPGMSGRNSQGGPGPSGNHGGPQGGGPGGGPGQRR